MSALGELAIGACVIFAIVGAYFLLSCHVPVDADAPPGSDPPRVLSVGRLAFGLVCLAVVVVVALLVLAGVGPTRLANH